MYFVYILASRAKGPIYIGMTSNLRQRVEQHRAGAVKAHTRKYRIFHLVYFESHTSAVEAREREARLKRWKRAWKDELINSVNPNWHDLSNDIPL